jgi:hypothetical protein
MALSLILGEARLVAEQMDTKVEVTLEKNRRWFCNHICSSDAASQNPERRSRKICGTGRQDKVRLSFIYIDEGSYQS